LYISLGLRLQGRQNSFRAGLTGHCKPRAFDCHPEKAITRLRYALEFVPLVRKSHQAGGYRDSGREPNKKLHSNLKTITWQRIGI